MTKTHMLLLVALMTVIVSGCGVLDCLIGGVGSIHSTRFTIDVSSSGGSRDGDQALDTDRDILLEQVRTVARAHHFMDKTLMIGGEPKPMAYFETTPPWLCSLKVYQTNGQLSVELWQYYEKRKSTPLYKETKTALTNALTNRFADRLTIRSERQLRYPWQSD